MRFSWLILLFFLCPFITKAQNGIITGKVVTKGSKSPIARASVFLSNSSFGAISATDGSFTLSNLRPGQYTLVVTILGYADYTQKVLVAETPIKVDIEMEPKSIELREVVISNSSRADWRRNYAQFVKEFIGTDENAKYCEIVNPQIINFSYHKTQQVLEAYTDDFLVVENRGLGYRVKFLLKNFRSDKIAGIVSYEGQRLFEELSGSASQKKKWMANRNLSYYGSAMHFYRALYTDKLKEEGFEARKLTRTVNTLRPPEEVIQRKITMFKTMNRIDSANHWIDLENSPLYAHQKVDDYAWFAAELLRTSGQPGIFVITFPDYLYVIYTKKREETPFKDLFVPLDMPNYEISVVTLLNKERYALFDKNGIIVDQSPLYEGTWSKSRLSQLLPVDFVPSDQPQ